MKRQNPSPGDVTGGNKYLALTREVNLDMQSSDTAAEEIKEVIPVPDSLKKEATFIDVCTCKCCLCQRVLISAAPYLGNKVICRYLSNLCITK